MHISRLALDHYRSWDHCVLDFEPGINILQGSNGLGKTNIVEAVEVLSTGSSHRTSSSLPLVEKGHPSATVRANVEDAGEQRTYEITIAARGANRARVDGGKSQYMRDIVGLVPSVSFTPEDQRLVSGDPATRRNFLNQAASLLLPRYAQSLQQFTHVAKQRAALLKQLSDGSGIDPEYGRQAVLSGLEVWTGQFIALGVQLTKDRNDVIGLLREPFTRIYASLAGEEEQADLVYEPSFDEVLLFDEPAAEISRHFQRIYPGEVARGQNLIGPQRDDLTRRCVRPARRVPSRADPRLRATAGPGADHRRRGKRYSARRGACHRRCRAACAIAGDGRRYRGDGGHACRRTWRAIARNRGRILMPKPPICELLNLDQRKLPAEVFDRISDRAGRLKEREERARKAWESFGEPGRDPETVGSLFNLLASNGAWIPHLKMAQMRDHWDQVVGVENAKHSYPASLRDGVLTIRCDSPAWTTTLSYMTPLLTDTIRRKLEGLTINEVRVTGPQSQGFSRGRISRKIRY